MRFSRTAENFEKACIRHEAADRVISQAGTRREKNFGFIA